jgi:hypothetical protein
MIKSLRLQYIGALAAILFLLLFSLYTFTYCENCFVGEFQVKKLVLFAGIVLCAGRLIFNFIQAENKKYVWLQSLLPLFILFELILLFFDRISFFGALIIIPVLEIIFVIGIIFFTGKAVRESQGFVPLDQVLNLFLPSFLVRWIIFEVTIISYAFRGILLFFKSYEEVGWSYWKSSSFPLIFALLILVAPIEILVINILFNIQSITIHIVFGVIYIWSLLYLYGFWISIKLLPHKLGENEISIYRGILNQAQFPLKIIETVKSRQNTDNDTLKQNGLEIADLTVQGTPIVEFVLNESIKVSSIIGKSEKFVKVILISADEPHLLVEEIRRISEHGG